MSSKRERQEAAQLDAAKRIGRQALTLSGAMLRVDALSEKVEEQMRRLAARPESEDDLRTEALEATKRLENSDLPRANALFSMMLAALYPVVEKWQEWQFADAEVDRLLQSPNVKLLEKYRHVVFHADYYDSASMKKFMETEDMTGWTGQLAAALRDYLKRWHADPMKHVKQHMARVGS